MEELEVGQSCEGLGKTVGDIRGGSMIVGLRRGARFEPQPPGDTALAPGDIIIAIGTPRTLDRLEALLEDRRS
jgi:voltage-gated potassium channel